MSEEPALPAAAIRGIVRPVQAFIQLEIAGGILLLLATAAALAWANSPWDESYFELIHETLTVNIFGVIEFEEDLQHVVNDGLMALFFFVVGLEIKREVTRGELRGRDKAALPAVAALGGMIIPAVIYTAFNAGSEAENGWGIPMATDIAFALALLALVGSRIPPALRVFLLALAIVDDIGAIIVIAIFYTSNLDPEYLLLALLLLAAMQFMYRAGVNAIPVYFLVGLLVWLAVFESGVHATIAGVVLGIMTPVEPRFSPGDYDRSVRDLLALHSEAQDAGDAELASDILRQIEDVAGNAASPLEKLEHGLHPYTSYLIVPIFAFVNAGVVLTGGIVGDSLSSAVTIGIALGLLVGKPTGILLFSWLAVRLRLASLPEGTSWPHVAGVGVLAGVGFTVSLFINDLAFDAADLTDYGKIGIFIGSFAAAVLGLLTLLAVTHRQPPGRNPPLGRLTSTGR
jgi:NhaA family Na+:H+ antiporter